MARYDDCYAVVKSARHIEELSLESHENGLIANQEFEVSRDAGFDDDGCLISNVTMEYRCWDLGNEGNINVLEGSHEGTWREDNFPEELFEVFLSLVEDNDWLASHLTCSHN